MGNSVVVSVLYCHGEVGSKKFGLRFLREMRLGAVHKVRHAREEGVRQGVTVCDRWRGVKSM